MKTPLESRLAAAVGLGFLLGGAWALCAAPASAQSAYPCGNGQCLGSRGQDSVLGGQLQSTVGPNGDGGIVVLQPFQANAPLVIRARQATGTATTASVTIQALNKQDGGTILSVKNGLVEVFAVGAGGITGIMGVLDGGPITATTISGTTITSTTGAQNKYETTVGIDAGSVRIDGVYAPVAASVDGGTSMTQRIQFGMGTLAANELAVTFNPAFGVAPQCVCSSVNGTSAACGPSVVPTTTTGTFKGANATDIIQWICVGGK